MTVTVKEHTAVLPAWSVTLKVFVVVPTGKLEFDANPAVRVVVEGQLSVPTGVVYGTAAVHTLLPVLVEIGEGHEMDGPIKSLTVTVAMQVSAPPAGPTLSATVVEG